MSICRRFIYSIIALLFYLPINLSGQPDNLTFEHLTIRDGLPENSIPVMLQDRQGFLWLSTQSGLVKYDGYDMTVYQKTLGLTNIRSLVEDSMGNIWGYVWTNNIVRFNPAAESFEEFLPVQYSKALFDTIANLQKSDQTISAILGVGDKVDSSEVFILAVETTILICATGEGINGELWDYGWIEDADSTIVWEMDRQKPFWDGGSLKNKIQAVLITLPAGSYRLRYRSDRSHSSVRWNDDAPLHPHLWGIQLLTVRNKTELETILASTPYQQGLDILRIRGIQSSSDGRNLWIITYGYGLFKMDIENLSSQQYASSSRDSTSIPTSYLNSIYTDKDGVVWIATNRGLIKFLPETERFTLYQSEESIKKRGASPFGRICGDRKGNIWVTGYTSDGLYEFNPRTEKFAHYPLNPEDTHNYANSEISAIQDDQQGHIWIGTIGSGLNIFDKKKKRFYPYRYDSKSFNGISGHRIWSIYRDRSGVMWVGSWGRGLNKADIKKSYIKQYQHAPADSNSLSGNEVAAVAEDASGRLWVGTAANGLNMLKGRNSVGPKASFKHYRHDPDNPNSLSSNKITALHKGHSGKLWIGTYDGLNLFDPDKDRFIRYQMDPAGSNSLRGNRIWDIHEDTSGILWIGTEGGGLNRYDPVTDNFTNYSTGLYNKVYAIYEDRFGTLWIGANLDYLQKFDRESGQFKTFKWKEAATSILSLFEDQAGNFWLGTYQNGLYLFDRDSETFTRFAEKEGLIHNQAINILEDNSGRLWVSNRRGIFIFDSGKKLFQEFKIGNELLKLPELGAFKNPKTGEMFWGGQNGLIVFHPDSIEADPYPPQIAITEFKLFNQTVAIGADSPLKKTISLTDTLQLAYWQNDVSFTFAALHFSDPAANQYAYYLENYEDSWRAASTRREAVYTNLDPGEYVFRVKASNSDGRWNETGKSLWIIISPPWWKTTWAYISYVLFGILAIFAIIKLRTRQLEVRSRELEETVEERTLEIREQHQEIRAQHQELETLEGIVRTINKESELEKVLHVLLEQGLALFPQAEKGTFLLRDGDNDLFRIAAANGYDDALIKDVTLSEAELVNRYTEQSQQIEKRAYIVREFQESSAQKKMKDFPRPQSLLAMAVVLEERLEGFLVLDNFSSSEAFVDSDVEKLARFRQHAVSAIDKAKRLQEVKAKNAELIRTREQLIVQEKLASLGQLTAGIAHEIKNPLNFVNNFAELLVEMVAEVKEDIEAHKGMLDNETLKKSEEILADADDLLGEISENAQKINEHGKRANNIVNGMLQHSRGKSGEFQATDLNALLDEYISLAYHGMRAKNGDFNVTIERDFDESVGEIPLVPQDISRVFLNLLNNAFEAFDVNGKSPTVKVSSKNLGEQVAVRIRDNGPGIPEDVRKQIFNPFFTTKPTGQGNTGLGLSISHDIVVKVHRGEISVDSQPGEYTEFVILLPKEKEGVLKK